MRPTSESIVLAGALMLSVLLAQACSQSSARVDADFIRRGAIARSEAIRIAAPEEAVRLYILSANRIVPFDTRARNAIAARGAEVKGALLNRLARASTDLDRWACITALGRADELHEGLVYRDTASMAKIQLAVSAMRDDFFRADCAQLMRALRAQGVSKLNSRTLTP